VKHVLVTGGNGFIGSYVVAELLDRGYDVDVLDTRYRETPEGSHVVLGDLRDASAVTEAVAHVEGVIHLAGVLGTQETIDNPRPAVETNIIGGLNLLQAIAQHKVPAVNIAVGNHWMDNTYAISKSTMERFVRMYNAERGTSITSVRALTAYGPRQVAAAPYGPSKVRKIMPSFICRALSGDPIEVYGDGQQIMDMIYVGDVARILVDALEATEQQGSLPTIEAGTGRETTVNDIARSVIDEVAARTDVRSEVRYLPMRPGETERAVVRADTSTLATIGLTQADLVSLEDGVTVTVDYYMSVM
jgi:UDP-glucose 4-epimerase